MQAKKITTIIQWQDGMVMVFDEDGEQMPQYQGRVDDVRDKILKVAPDVPWERRVWQGS
jgi:hypothetical protein